MLFLEKNSVNKKLALIGFWVSGVLSHSVVKASDLDYFTINRPFTGCSFYMTDENTGKEIKIKGNTNPVSEESRYLEPCGFRFDPTLYGKAYKYCALSGVSTGIGYQQKPGCSVGYAEKDPATGKPALFIGLQGAGTICEFWCLKK